MLTKLTLHSCSPPSFNEYFLFSTRLIIKIIYASVSQIEQIAFILLDYGLSSTCITNERCSWCWSTQHVRGSNVLCAIASWNPVYFSSFLYPIFLNNFFLASSSCENSTILKATNQVFIQGLLLKLSEVILINYKTSEIS